ncbi:MAG: PAS domain-containing protein [Acidobacteria bacterium]|nr:PAS domain-containing protein [Acidobacteriota bacterium]
MADSLARASTERAVRALRGRALASLFGLAGLALLSYFVGIKVAEADLYTTAAIDIGVRIRMLTQRAALLAEEMATPTDPAASAANRRQLGEIPSALNSAHKILVAGDLSGNIPASVSAEMHKILYELPFTLDARMGAFIAEVNGIVSAHDPADSHLRAIREMAMTGPLLDAVDAAVAQSRKDSEKRALRLWRIQMGTLALSLLALLASGMFLFAPMLRRVRTDMYRLAEATARARELEAENEERRRAEAALRESEERFRQMAESISGVFWISDAVTDEMIYVSHAYERVFQRTRASLYESPGSWLEAVHPDDRGRVAEESMQARSSGALDHEYRIAWPDGTIRWIRTRIFPVRNADGNVSRYTGICDDITEQRLVQNQMGQSQKLEAIGQLAAGIAHEINTPAQYVGDNIRFLRDSFDELDRLLLRSEKLFAEASRGGQVPPGALDLLEESVRDVDVGYLREEIPKAIEQSLEGIARITKIVRAMKDFSHPGLQERLPVDINQAIETTLTVAQNELTYVADIVTRFDRDLPSVPCYPNEINQVVLNILINAADAIADAVGRDSGRKGTISISTARVDSWAEIRIGDTGSGIPAKIRGRIFDPFFTTKDVGKGTGQGLALSHAIIVEKHQGSITFESDVDRGTTFIIRLPLQPGG